MDDNSVATFRDNVGFRLETVPALDYYVKDPAEPQWVTYVPYLFT